MAMEVLIKIVQGSVCLTLSVSLIMQMKETLRQFFPL